MNGYEILSYVLVGVLGPSLLFESTDSVILVLFDYYQVVQIHLLEQVDQIVHDSFREMSTL